MFASHGYKNSVAGAVASDPNFENVTLLLHADGTNGSQNNTFLDSSTNNFTITRNGTPTQGSLSPYGNNWSNYFNGSTDYLTRAFSSTADGMYLNGTTYTIEAWVYINSITGDQVVYDCSAINQINFGTTLFYINNGVVYFSVRPTTGGSLINVSGGSIIANTWNHIAVSVNASSCKLFLNGTQIGSTTTIPTASFTPVGAAIGRRSNGYTTGYTDLNGYISNLRIVKGTALYTANFTPSTSNLTAVAGTSLLTCQSNRFKDNSSNNFIITTNGTPSVQTFSPFNPTSEYSITTNGGSGYFNGTNGNYLSVPSNAAFNFTSGAFTVEAWVMFFSTAASTQFVLTNYNSTTTGWYIQLTSSKFACGFSGDGGDIIGTTTVVPNAWYHVAISGSVGSYKLFVNGTQEGATYTGATSLAGGNLGIGALGDRSGYIGTNPVNGYISNARIVNGTALYTANFTPPTSPVTAVANTSLLCNFTNAGIFDNAVKNDLLTVGTSQISTAQKKYGTGSMLFNVSTDYCRTFCPPKTHQFGTGDFTIECWAYCTNLAGGNAGTMEIIDFRSATSVEVMPTLIIAGSTFIYFTNGITRCQSGTISANTWYHVAVVRYSGNTELYVNGTNVGVTYADTNNYLDGTPTIGNYLPNPVYGFAGYIDDVRITKGIARYTANFTTPTQAFPNL